MRTLHTTLHLQHRSHTGKVLHHTHTSYRALAVILTLSGLFIVGLNIASHVAADTFGVSAMVGVPVPSSAPSISTPASGTAIAGPGILVTGSCPLVTPQVVIEVSVDGNPAGTSACDSNNDFTVSISMTPGQHMVAARSLTMSNQKGPSSHPIIVTTSADLSSVVPITANSPFIYAAGRTITWAGLIGAVNDANNHYVHIDWGDNSQSNYVEKTGAQSFSHTYATLGSHNIALTAYDSSTTSRSEQFAEAGFTSASFPQAAESTTPIVNTRTVAGLYGLYLSAVCVTVLIWIEAKHAARERARQHAMA